MPLALGSDHVDLSRSVRSVLEETKALSEARRRLDRTPLGLPAYWAKAQELGWFGLHIDERHGGEGFGLLELAIVIEELGRACSAGPFLPQVFASAAVQRSGTDDLRRRWLPALCTGGLDVHADGMVSGEVSLAVGTEQATLLLLVSGEDDLVAIEVCDVLLTRIEGLDPTTPLCSVRLDRAPVAGVLTGAAAALRELAWMLAPADATGGMAACLDLATEHAQQREQFGRPIGAFQAVKHLLVDMLSDLELCTAAVWDACGTNPAELATQAARYAAASATTITPERFVIVAETAVQVLGGIGFTWEHDAHMYLRRAGAWRALLSPGTDAAETVTQLHLDGGRPGMRMSIPPSGESYRAAARAAVELISDPELSPEQRQRLLARSGYLVPHWPRPYGVGADPLEQLVIESEFDGVHRPCLNLGDWVLPTVLQFISPEQQQRWIWASLEGEIRWCQLFIEPGAGSDAAAIRTRAVRVDGGWRVSGQRIWNSLVLESQRDLLTTHTDSTQAKHRGITTMALDLASPGIEVRPIRKITGETQFNEVFLDDVFVPDADVVGEVGDGWAVARATFDNERVTLGEVATSMVADDPGPLVDESTPPTLHTAYGVLPEAHALRALNMRQTAGLVFGNEAGPQGNVAKLVGSEHSQHVANLGMRARPGSSYRGRTSHPRLPLHPLPHHRGRHLRDHAQPHRRALPGTSPRLTLPSRGLAPEPRPRRDGHLYKGANA